MDNPNTQFVGITDEQLILKAEQLGFRFHKHKNCWQWTAIAPDNDTIVIEQGDPKGMAWLRTKMAGYKAPPQKMNRRLQFSRRIQSLRRRITPYAIKTLALLCILAIPCAGSWFHRQVLPWWGHLLIWAGYAAYWAFGWMACSDNFPPETT